MNIQEITGFDYSTSPLDAYVDDTPRYRDMLEAIKDHLGELDRMEALFAVEMKIPSNGDWDLYDLIDTGMDQNHLVNLTEGYDGIQRRIQKGQATPSERRIYQGMRRLGHSDTGYSYDLPHMEGRFGEMCDFMKFNHRGAYRFLNDKDIVRFINNLLRKVNHYIENF